MPFITAFKHYYKHIKKSTHATPARQQLYVALNLALEGEQRTECRKRITQRDSPHRHSFVLFKSHEVQLESIQLTKQHHNNNVNISESDNDYCLEVTAHQLN